MIGSDIKALIGKCNKLCTQALYDAGGLAVGRSNYEVAAEHFLLKCLDDQNSDITRCLNYFKLDRPAVLRHLNGALENFASGNSARPAFSPILLELLEAAWIVASVDLKQSSIRSGAVLMAYLKRPGLYAQGGAAPELARLSRDELEKNFLNIVRDSAENSPAGATEESAGETAALGSGESFAAKFCEDFTAKAAAGAIDPVFGRDNEIRSLINILARRRKNNPILVGEPGVGKTAVIEGLAIRIKEGDVPEMLKDVTLLGLDLGLLEAGASVKGEFERRLKGVIDEIKASPRPIILFIDEAHMLVGAGGSAGGSDAANLLKPVLARGELKTCAATTWKEYKKYFEKDPALARRFQLVSLDEPSPETTTLILRGLRDAYEKSHQVLIRDEALQAAAEMSHRYISGRFLPDKAVDLLDTACARVKIGLAAQPAPLEKVARRIQAVERERAGLARDQLNGHSISPDRLKALEDELAVLAAEKSNLTESWEKQKTVAAALIAARAALAADPKSEESLKNLDEARAAYEAAGTGGGLIEIEVSAEVVAQVVSDWTGIPLGRIATEQAALVSELEKHLAERIKGQTAAVAAISKVIKASKAGLRDPAQPLGVFLLIGPSGVGKTETGLALADLLFGDASSVVTINMSEFQEKHTVSRLLGSPPGYVGYGEGGLLTEAVRQRPYCVVLLDEVEKAHLDVLNLFYQVFDKGVLTDGEGQKISFSNTIIILTSNLASDITETLSGRDPEASLEELTEAIRPTLSRHFKPALLARMTIVPYRSLDLEALTSITVLKLETLKERIRRNNGVTLTYGDEVTTAIVSRCRDAETGARNIDYILAADIMPRLAQDILTRLSAGEEMPSGLTLSWDEEGGFKISFDEVKA